MKKRDLMGGTSIRAAALVFRTNHQLAGTDRKRLLWRMPDGTLALRNGTPIRAGELVPGQEYEVQSHPSCFEGAKK